MSKATNPTGTDEITPQMATGEVRKTDNPLDTTAIINLLHRNNLQQRAITAKLRLNDNGYYVLMNITAKWVNDRKASSVYSLAQLPKNSTISATATVVRRLMGKGLIEVVGKGERDCRVYAPTYKALLEMTSVSG